MSQQVQKLFDQIAPRYDLLNGLLSLKTDRFWRRAAVREIAAPEFRNVLDLCAGTLALTKTFLETNPKARVTAVDFSEPMLRKGWDGLPKGMQASVGPLVADAMELDLPPRSLDAAMCAYGMRNIDDNEAVLRRLSGFLRRRGKLVILEFFRPEGLINKLFNATYAQFVIPAIGRLVSGNTQAYRYLRDSVRHYYTPTAFRELLKQTGYRKISLRPLTGGITHLVTAEAA